MNERIRRIDPRLYQIEPDGDGYLVWLAAGWRSEPGVHGFHADTMSEAEDKLLDIEPCSCEQCGDLV